MIFCLSAPSGTGKTSLIRELLTIREDFSYPISATTRKPRPNEVDGYDYFFISHDEFKTQIKKQAFLEYAQVFDNFYGTFKKSVLESKTKHVILDMDWQGVSKANIEMVKIFLLPPSLKSLRERLRKRGQNSEEEVKKRVANAKVEIAHAKHYDYIVINEDFEQTLKALLAIVLSQEMRSQNVKLPNYV